MTIEECYTNMGADYGDVLRRLGNEDRVKRFLGKIPEDTSFSLLCEAYEKGDGREAFRAAHSLKGICMNLGLTVLYTSSAALAEELRGGALTEASASMLEQVKKDYQIVTECIRKFLHCLLYTSRCV